MNEQQAFQSILSKVRPKDGHFKTIEEESNEDFYIKEAFVMLYPEESTYSYIFYDFSAKAKQYIFHNY